jgi:hypothetical protein
MVVICYYKAAGIIVLNGRVSELISQVASTATFRAYLKWEGIIGVKVAEWG